LPTSSKKKLAPRPQLTTEPCRILNSIPKRSDLERRKWRGRKSQFNRCKMAYRNRANYAAHPD
jgi:hypothetical protein